MGRIRKIKMSDPAYKPPLCFRLALRLQKVGRICGTLRNNIIHGHSHFPSGWFAHSNFPYSSNRSLDHLHIQITCIIHLSLVLLVCWITCLTLLKPCLPSLLLKGLSLFYFWSTSLASVHTWNMHVSSGTLQRTRTDTYWKTYRSLHAEFVWNGGTWTMTACYSYSVSLPWPWPFDVNTSN